MENIGDLPQKTIYLKYYEESPEKDEGYKLKNTLVYNGQSDFYVGISGERVDMDYDGSSIHEDYPEVTEVKIIKEYEILGIEFLDKYGKSHFKTVINHYAFDYFVMEQNPKTLA